MSDSERNGLGVVIPTLGRPILAQTLESLAASEGAASLSVIIAGMIPDEALAARVRELGRHFQRFELLPLAFETGDSSRKKTAGLEALQTDIVAFLDDDVVVSPDWPARMLEAFDDAQVGMASAPSLVPDDLALMPRLAGLALTSRAAGYVSDRYRMGAAGLREIRWSRIIGCNMAFRRSVLVKLGGFDPRFWPGEEMVAAFGVARAGHKIVFQPSAWVRHYPRATLRGFLRQIYGYGATRIRLIRAGLECEPTTLAPAVMIAGALILGAAACCSSVAASVLAAVAALYLLAVLVLSAEMLWITRRPSDALLFAVIPLMHAVYGLGQWYEFLRPGRDLSGRV